MIKKILAGIFSLAALITIALLLASISPGDIIDTNQSYKKPQITIPSATQGILLEENGIYNCQAAPIKNFFVNQKIFSIHDQNYIVSCDPNFPGFSRCCYTSYP